METDDGVRARVGVIACVRPMPNGKTRLIFDDANADSARNPTAWTPERLFTWNDYDASRFADVELTQEQFAQIGENLVMRLVALHAAASK